MGFSPKPPRFDFGEKPKLSKTSSASASLLRLPAAQSVSGLVPYLTASFSHIDSNQPSSLRATRFSMMDSARAGNRRFGLFSALRVHTKTP